MLAKTFDAATLEARHYQRSLEARAFVSGQRPDAEPFTLLMPPPNVTGQLHIGHALTFTLQDILCRYQRMKGRDVRWQPGTDHAGIATQMVVEKQLAQQGTSRKELGRKRFVEKVWEWKEQSGDAISGQLQRLGASADWDNSRFTLDEGPSRAVRRAFVQLYNDGLLYRGQRLVNWDVTLQTAISDLEVVSKEQKGTFWHIRYLLAEGNGHITVATTRPETLFGDVAVAVHPDDARYSGLIGKHVYLPLTERTIPIIADTYSDPEKGTGAVKITPAHDFNDFAVGQRHKLEAVNILNRDGTLNEEVPAAFQRMDRLKARPVVVQALEEQGLLEKTESAKQMLPTGDRSGAVIEPFLTEQWFVDARPLAEKAMDAVKSGDVRFVPKQWENTYFRWLEDIQPWCVSRQLWWGHRIPAWYSEEGEVFVAEDSKQAHQLAAEHYGKPVPLAQDGDVLDTWFSSGLWPFSTLGWPEDTPALQRYYPTQTLITGFDIIFFWVARMMMMGLHLTGKAPFKDIYIHALVRDEQGQKMSKSKGNVIDPLQVVSQYGTDALRFTLAILAAQGRDVKLSLPRVEGYRNFTTKLWNAARFLEMNGCAYNAGFSPETAQHEVNRWILAKWQTTLKDATTALEEYRFNDAAQTLYHFVWHSFCDWYLEFSKPLLQEGQSAQEETRHTAAAILHACVHALHPFMPYITDELAQQMGYASKPLTLMPWPQSIAGSVAEDTGGEIDALVELISTIRTARSEVGVPGGAQLDLVAVNADPRQRGWLTEHTPLLLRMARLKTVTFAQEVTPESLHIAFANMIVCLPVGGVIDIDAEKERLRKDLEKANSEQQSLKSRLSNPAIRQGAPEEVIDEWESRLTALEKKIKDMSYSLNNL